MMTDQIAQESTQPGWQTQDHLSDPVLLELRNQFGPDAFSVQATRTGMPVIWVRREQLLEVVDFLKKLPKPYVMLFDLHGVDERQRIHRQGLPEADFSVFYHLISIDRNRDIMLKVALSEKDLNVPSLVSLFPNANWYEREVWDMFGITFQGHPNLRRLLMSPSWEGHPLRKDYPARATEFDPFELTKQKQDLEMEALTFKPEEWGMSRGNENEDFMFLNLGPNHPSSHGAFRIVLQLDGEEIVNCVPDIGYHHRGAEKMGERQSWHSYIPYTDRIEYLGGCVNEMPYVLAVEKLAGIEVPDRVKTIRVMLSELFRINSHLLYISTYIQDTGAMTPVFFAFTDRQKVYNVVEAITGFRMHPAWFRIGGVAHDLPRGWDKLLRELLDWLPKRLESYVTTALKNSILKGRSIGVASYTKEEALAWGVTGAGLRATGVDFDVRKWRPYSGYENFEFDIPIAHNGDCYDRVMIKVEEMRQSIRILEQCLKHMPEGPFKADHPLTTPPPKERTLQHIETLINHFLQVSWGPVMPANESFQMIEATKGINSYYLTSDGSTMSYRTRIRTPSYAHLQQIPAVISGSLVSDLIVYLGSIDFVMSDVDR
ncbi:NADH-quinone oxidoreductase subunit C/D [Providencia manganoxydans]|uniref:NADH-quinone oxidoreductase subunit C/D n=1 Tax=Providencia manganoxydans TaxID=2923283 RepID=A0ABX7AIV0_9GAMM|nr:MULTISPECIES: NADH-quinone oxidoreductase subunit C/D [Providencia]ELR5039664.1 NADH-quinone oxidoreductase subunit C/D [Providencia stuartii]ELR5080885.1 NADH-quinone oxidoreductase subunit C/D [Providencia stuartii]MDX4945245.1 NADH-quinone oxidoreductase subunit C/D [Providencia manganoxydans]QQO63896.1 NADH-quinone oxidoreductase subunit C/D [Providencia manganoxydans]HEF8772263.1 NADH-quinone oxidoreductase subunit C/D [Providencia stuartii]